MGRVEQIFSRLKIVKTNNRTSLNTDTLDDLLEVFVEGPSLRDFSADSAVDLWWKDSCTSRRPNQGPRKAYQEVVHLQVSGDSSESQDIGTEVSTISLDDWDDGFMADN